MINDYRLSNYQLLKTLQKGRYGEVELVLHKELKCRRVIKTVYKLHPFYEVLANEARILQSLRNEAIPIVFDVFENAAGLSFIEEALEGETLTNYLRRKMKLSPSELLDYSVKLSDILNFLHESTQRVLYLDMKPDNIMVADHKMKLIDFGSAICRVETKEENVVFGTKGFAAPEQTGEGVIGKKTDIYALGKTFEYMLLYASIAPKGYSRVVNNCLRKGKVQYSKASDVKKALLGLRGKTGETVGEIRIAVVGVPTDYHSSGFAFDLSKALQRKSGRKVLLLDCNKKGNLETLDNSKSEPRGFTFVADKVIVAKRVLPQEIKGWRGYGSKYIVCDFGNAIPANAGIPFDYTVYVGSVQPWTGEAWKHLVAECYDGSKRYCVLTEKGISTPFSHVFRCFNAFKNTDYKKVTRCLSRLMAKRKRQKRTYGVGSSQGCLML